jgi:protein SCO1/2
MTGRRNRLIPLIAATATALWLAGCGPQNTGGSADQTVSTGEALIGGPFQLVDQDGKVVDQTLLDGKWTAVFFGYTYCPDVCPTTLQTLAAAQQKLGARAKDLQVVFVSVDPERDTPAQIKAYLAAPAFPKGTIGLTGSAAQVAAAAKAYRVYYQKQGTGEGYTLNHSSIVYLMNPKGKFDRVVSESQTPAEIATQIGDAIASGPKAKA